MSYFAVKMIAIITMFIDHIGVVVGSSGLGMITYNNTFVLRTIGRIALPIFAYNIINGWNHTKYKPNYIYRLILFACISQIPFSLVVNPINYAIKFDTISAFTALNFDTMPINFWIIALVFLASHIIMYKNSDPKMTIALLIATLFTLISVRTDAGLLYTNPYKLNVFYTLGTAAYIFGELEAFRNSSKDSIPLIRILRVLSIFTIAFLFCSFSDYSFMGLFLILAIYAARNNKLLQLTIIAFWCILIYKTSMYFLTSALLSVLVIYLYNGKKGYSNKYLQILTYIFYPLHLSILGLIVLFK